MLDDPSDLFARIALVRAAKAAKLRSGSLISYLTGAELDAALPPPPPKPRGDRGAPGVPRKHRRSRPTVTEGHANA